MIFILSSLLMCNNIESLWKQWSYLPSHFFSRKEATFCIFIRLFSIWLSLMVFIESWVVSHSYHFFFFLKKAKKNLHYIVSLTLSLSFLSTCFSFSCGWWLAFILLKGLPPFTITLFSFFLSRKVKEVNALFSVFLSLALVLFLFCFMVGSLFSFILTKF